MSSAGRPAFLRLVHSEDEIARPNAEIGPAGSAQGLFFPSKAANTLIFADWERTSLVDIFDVLELSKPKLVFDLRVTPRFDLERLSRRQFFAMLQQHDCVYIDLFGRVGISSVRDAGANALLIARKVGEIIAAQDMPYQGPFVFFYDDEFFDDDYIHSFATALPQKVGPWQVFSPSSRRPTVAKPQPDLNSIIPLERRAIFISHATPQDNTFVEWLSSKLILAGYEVWSDLAKLQPGDTFWSDIEVAIRTRAAKVLFVYSKDAIAKVGTRKEVYLALKTAEAQGIERFVIPIRIDPTPFEETFVELIDIQAIDCRDNWLKGLNGLVSLLQRDRIPRDSRLAADKFSFLLSKAVSPAFTTVRTPENLISTWLPVISHPSGVHFYSCAGLMPQEIATCAKMLGIPAFGYFALLATTADIDRTSAALEAAGLGHVGLSERAYIAWNDFTAARWADLPRVGSAEARRFAALLINRALANYLSSRDTLVGQLSSGRPFWFFGEEKFSKNEVRFTDYRGKSIRRQIVGYSQKRRVFWHFAIQARYAVMGGLPYVILSPHVTFTADGRTILPSKAQLHSLRRSFCRSWWNKRWRDLLQGFVAALAGPQPIISISVGADAPVTIETAFKIFEAPESPISSEVEPTATTDDDKVEDDWDEDEALESPDDDLIDDLPGSFS